MDKVLAFILGGAFIFFVFNMSTTKLQEVWQAAYQAGKNDGYSLGQSEFSYMSTRDYLESKCLFLYERKQ